MIADQVIIESRSCKPEGFTAFLFGGDKPNQRQLVSLKSKSSDLR